MIEQYSVGPMENNTYLIVDESYNEAAIVDPSFDSQYLLDQLKDRELTLRYILNTHGHFDHVVENARFKSESDALLAIHHDDLNLLQQLPAQANLFGFSADPSPEPDFFLEDGQTLSLGLTDIKVIHTPGHSPGGVTFLVEDAAIVGDCLFVGSIGRWDLPGASLQTLLDSIQSRLLALPDATHVLSGHGPATTIGQERVTNPFLSEHLR